MRNINITNEYFYAPIAKQIWYLLTKKIKIRTKTHFTAGITPVQKPNFSTNLLEKTTKCLTAKYRRSHHKPEQLHSWIHPTSGKHK